MIDLSGKVVMITGASGNLGRAAAAGFAAAGASLVLVDRSEERVAEVLPELAGSGAHRVAGGTDLGDAGAVEGMVAGAVERFGHIDGLFHTVGAFRGGKRVVDEDLDTWDFLFETNLRTALHCSRAVLPTMLERGTGAIVHTVSRHALHGAAGAAAYSAAKGALLRFTEALAAEVGEAGVTVNCIVPGTLDTPQNRAAQPDADTGRWVAPEAVATVAGFLISEAGRVIQGAAIPALGRS